MTVLERVSQTPYAGLVLRDPTLPAFVPVSNQASFAYGHTIGKVNALVTFYSQHTPDEYAATIGDFLLSANNFVEFDPAFTFTTTTTATRRYGSALEAGGGARMRVRAGGCDGR